MSQSINQQRITPHSHSISQHIRSKYIPCVAHPRQDTVEYDSGAGQRQTYQRRKGILQSQTQVVRLDTGQREEGYGAQPSAQQEQQRKAATQQKRGSGAGGEGRIRPLAAPPGDISALGHGKSARKT